MWSLILFSVAVAQVIEPLSSHEIIFVILSQSDSYHVSKGEELRESILRQAETNKDVQRKILGIKMIHEDFPVPGAWTVVPIFSWLENQPKKANWVVFVEERTGVNVNRLYDMLQRYDPKKEVWMGRALFDTESTIIHHFAFAQNPTAFKYPLFSSGFVMSMSLISRLVKEKKDEVSSDFSIDAAHELALYVGDPLLDFPDKFCVQKQEGCATFTRKFSSCGERIPKEDIFFAVKTCVKFHNDRIPVVKDTWGKQALHVEFFSHEKDDRIPTTDVGVANTERGHCMKTFAIFRLVMERAKHIPSLRWVILADDDTMLSVSRLQELLSCWNSSIPIAIGERYGYSVRSGTPGGSGYNYLTGGGGIVFSLVTLDALLQHCSCQAIDTPDDMYIGICLARLNIPVVHWPDFHQARPNDYATDYLAAQRPVSFHKHWMIDPVATYKKWFMQDDISHSHIEL